MQTSIHFCHFTPTRATAAKSAAQAGKEILILQHDAIPSKGVAHRRAAICRPGSGRGHSPRLPLPSHGEANSRRCFGFTLIEAMVVLAVLAILVAIGVPSFQSVIASSRVRSAANDVLLGLNVARVEAIRQNGSIRFCMNASTGAWQVATTTGTAIRTGSLPTNVSIATANLDTTSVSGQACVRFRADGLSYGTGSALITNGSVTVTAGSASRVINVKAGALHVG